MARHALLGGLLAAAVTAAGPAAAQGPKVLGNFSDWTAFTDGSGRSKVCYIASQPKKEQGKYTRRGDTFILVTHRPSERTRDTVEIRAGYTYKKGSDVTLSIDGRAFKLFTNAGSAWARDQKTDTALANAMRRGSTMVIRGTSSRGTRTTDTYSLKGFTAAHRAIGKACGLTS